MQSWLLVMAGGAIGAGARYALADMVGQRLGTAFPWGTLTVNVLGCFAMGLLAGWLLRAGAAEPLRLFVGVGLLGGFTTFSAFSLDWWQLAERGAPGTALAYAAVSLLAALVAYWLGLSLLRAAS